MSELAYRPDARPRTRRRLVSAGTARAVLVVIASTLVAGCAATTAPPTTAAIAPVQRSIPPYYVELDSLGPITTFPYPLAVATVRVTASGAAIARISAPKPYKGFIAVTGAADDRTFVLLANAPSDPFSGATPQRFFVLRIDPDAPSAAGRAQLTPLPAHDIPGWRTASLAVDQQQVQTMALSPDGRSLGAILTVRDQCDLYIYNLATGKTRVWVSNWTALGDLERPPGIPALSWTSNGRSLAFTLEPTRPEDNSQLRLLHLRARGSNVQASSTPLVIHASVSNWRQAVMTPDAKTVFLDSTVPGPNVYTLGSFSLMRFSSATGQLAAINTLPMIVTAGYASSGPLTADTILWTSDNGSKVIVADARPGHTLGVYSNRTYAPLPWSARAVGAAW